MWTYSQSTGELTAPDGMLFGVGFAGRDGGFDNPAMQTVKNIGPLPIGQYTMDEWFDKHPTVGLCAIRLTPCAGTDMCGRSGFLIHGPELAQPLESSHGCIVFGNCTTRREIWQSADHDLTVNT